MPRFKINTEAVKPVPCSDSVDMKIDSLQGLFLHLTKNKEQYDSHGSSGILMFQRQDRQHFIQAATPIGMLSVTCRKKILWTGIRDLDWTGSGWADKPSVLITTENIILIIEYLPDNLRGRRGHVGRRAMYTGFWWENQKGKRPLRRRWNDCIKMDKDGVVWTGVIWLKTENSGRACEHRNEPFGIHKMLGYSWVAKGLEAFQEGLSPMLDGAG
jgi:hypothetical protein